MDSCCRDVLVVLVDGELLWSGYLGGRGVMLSALTFELGGGADPDMCSTLGWSAILGLAHVLRKYVSSGLGV